jgi:hypothetical protein
MMKLNSQFKQAIQNIHYISILKILLVYIYIVYFIDEQINVVDNVTVLNE